MILINKYTASLKNNIDILELQALTRSEVNNLMGSFKECVEQINRKIDNFIYDFDKLEDRVNCCEVYASIETGDTKKWEQVLRLIKN